MNARLRDYRLLWSAAVSHGNPFGSAVIRWGFPIVALAIAFILWKGESPRAAVAWLWGLACAAALVAWMWRFLPGAVKLNSPANAWLVPRMRRRLVELSCLVWFAAIVAIALGPYANRGSLGIWLPWIVVGTIGVGLGVAGHRAGGPIILAACIGSAVLGKLPAEVHVFLSRPSSLALGLLAYAALIVVVARQMFPQGGERHWEMVAQRARVASKPELLLDKKAGKHTEKWYAASLRRACGQRDSRKLMLHALGPAHHLGEQLAALGMLSAVLVAVGILTTVRADAEVLAGIGWILACTLLSIPFAANVRMTRLANTYPDEGALVRLAPAMPGSAPAFNRQLGRALLRQALVVWGLASAAAVLLPALGGAGLPALLRQACICCLLLPLVAGVLRDYAVRAPRAALRPVLLLAVSVPLSVGIGFLARTALGVPVMPVAAVASIAFAAWSIVRKLRAMDALPFAFPAGRMD